MSRSTTTSSLRGHSTICSHLWQHNFHGFHATIHGTPRRVAIHHPQPTIITWPLNLTRHWTMELPPTRAVFCLTVNRRQSPTTQHHRLKNISSKCNWFRNTYKKHFLSAYHQEALNYSSNCCRVIWKCQYYSWRHFTGTPCSKLAYCDKLIEQYTATKTDCRNCSYVPQLHGWIIIIGVNSSWPTGLEPTIDLTERTIRLPNLKNRLSTQHKWQS